MYHRKYDIKSTQIIIKWNLCELTNEEIFLLMIVSALTSLSSANDLFV